MDVLERQDDDVTALAPPGRLLAALALAAVVAIVAGFVAGVVVPFFVNDLHQVPLAEVRSGAHQPDHLWPTGPGSGATLLVIAGGLAVLFGPIALPALIVFLGASLAVHRQDMDAAARRTAVAALALACAAGSLWLSPYGRAMTAWFLD